MVKVLRCEIIKPVGMDWKDFGDIIYELQKEVRFVRNKTIQMYNDWYTYSGEQKQLTGEYPKVMDVYGYKQFAGYAYDKLKNSAPLSNTANYTGSIRGILTAYDTKLKDILKGTASVPNANKNQPIDLHNKSIKIDYDSTNGSYYATLSLLSNEGKKKFGLSKGQVTVAIMCASPSAKRIVDACISGEYKVCGSQILRVDKKLYLNLAYNFQKDETVELDPKRIMGVDLGIVVPAQMAFNYCSYDKAKITDSRIMSEKHRMDKQLSQAKKNCTFTNDGHGRHNKMRCYERYSNRSHNMSQTINHAWAKYIVKQAADRKCATIQMEDLTGIKKHDDRFLGSWTYYDLQQKIEAKAKEKGITVVRVSPKYTSQRCSQCGYISHQNRPDQKTFKCISCGYEANADFNAARNIAVKDIDKIISESVVHE